jgi:predicted Zn-dependent protease
VSSAIEDYRRSHRARSQGRRSSVNLATVLESQGKYAEARDVLLDARKRGITDLDVLNALSVAYDLNGETDLAIAAVRESLQRDPAQDVMKRQLLKLEAKKASPSKPASAPEPAAKPATAPPSKGR